MITTVQAVYENQTLRLNAPLPVKDGATVEVTLDLQESAVPRRRFSWEDGPVASDNYAGDIADEVRRQRDGE